MPPRPIPLTLLVILLLAGFARRALAEEIELARDVGDRAGQQHLEADGHVVEFDTPAGAWWIRAIRVHGQRYGRGYAPQARLLQVAVCDADLAPLTVVDAPYSYFSSEEPGWAEIPLRRVFRAPPRFRVVVLFRATARRGVAVSWTEGDATFSATGLPGQSSPPAESGRAWVIRVVLVKSPDRETPKEMILALDDGVMQGREALTAGGHVIQLRRPKGSWWIRSLLLYARAFGGQGRHAVETFRVAVADPAMKPLLEQRVSYDAIGREFAWVEVPLDNPLVAPGTFRLAVNFDSHRLHGARLGYAATPRSKSFVGWIGARPKAWRRGDWMLRARLVSELPTPPPPPPKPTHDPRIYSQDFAFINETVRTQFPALETKGIDWSSVAASWSPKFVLCRDDETHIRNAMRLLAAVRDPRTGVRDPAISVPNPAYEGLYGAGLWIAAEGGHLVLRALRPDHRLEEALAPGAILTSIDGRPARIVHEEIRAKVRTWRGYSSRHLLDSRLSCRFFPFGERETLPARFLHPDGRVADVELTPWGPKRRPLSRAAATTPEGLDLGSRAVATKLAPHIGYVRILGRVDGATRDAFFSSLELVHDVEALLFDLRGVDQGEDDVASEIAGSFYSSPIALADGASLVPTGARPFTGPLVVLLDEEQTGCAEALAALLAESGRAVTLGKPTGGATLVPTILEVPSGIFDVALGHRERKTALRQARLEGTGLVPDISVPYDAALLQRFPDPAIAFGFDIAHQLATAVPQGVLIGLYGGLLGAEPDRLRGAWIAWRSYARPEGLKVPDFAHNLVDDLVLDLAALLDSPENPTPDVLGAGARLKRLAVVAEILGRKRAAQTAREVVASLEKEGEAQRAFLDLIGESPRPSDAARKAFGAAHEGTRWARAVTEAYPSESAPEK